MQELDEILARAVKRRPCVVVGSAPLRTLPVVVDPGEAVIVVNGAISSVAGEPDLWVVNGRRSAGPNWGSDRVQLNQLMVQQAMNRHVRCVIYLEKTDGADAAMRRRLAEQGTTFQHEFCMSRAWRQQLEERLFPERQRYLAPLSRNKHVQPIGMSAGLFAVGLALWGGAPRVRMVGFSWAAGYAYVKDGGPTVRGHQRADEEALARLQARFSGVVDHQLRLPADLVARVAEEVKGDERHMKKKLAAAEVKAAEEATLKVRALKLGFYGNRMQQTGDVFRLRRAQDFSPSWMERVSEDTPERQPSNGDRMRTESERMNATGPTARHGRRLKPNAADPIDDEGDDAPATGAEQVLG